MTAQPKAIRIAITGAQGTGKSTVIGDLESHCKDALGIPIKVVLSPGESVKQQGLPLGQAATVETILAFAVEHLRRECTEIEGVVLYDRCLLDLMCYASLLHKTNLPLNALLHELAACHMKDVDIVMYTCIEPELARSSVDRETSQFRATLDAELLKHAKSLGIAMHNLVGSRSERLQHASEIVDQAWRQTCKNNSAS